MLGYAPDLTTKGWWMKHRTPSPSPWLFSPASARARRYRLLARLTPRQTWQSRLTATRPLAREFWLCFTLSQRRVCARVQMPSARLRRPCHKPKVL
jgi:hypothetical protein